MKERQTLDEPRINRDPTVRRIPGGRSRTSGATHLEATPTASPSTKTSLCPKAEPQRLDHLGRPSLQSIFRPQVFDGRSLRHPSPSPPGLPHIAVRRQSEGSQTFGSQATSTPKPNGHMPRTRLAIRPESGHIHRQSHTFRANHLTLPHKRA